MKTATIVGAGLVGSLWSIFLAKAGYKLNIVESRGDLRKADISAGKSINLAFSKRGWTAFKSAGIESEIEDIVIPMHGRTMHDLEGNLTFQPYGQEDQAIYSVSRAGINCRMMDVAEKYGDTNIFFNEKCVNVDSENGIVYLENTKTGKTSELKSDLVFGTDGAFSAVRYRALQKLDRFQYSQNYIEDGYREILLPANEDGSYKLEKNSLHIWPRGRFMLIALPNEDGSFTCTLFMPFDDHEYAFNKLKSRDHVERFFQIMFPDFFQMLPDIADVWENHPLSSLAIIRCYPWTHGKTALMGDAAHATVPFYGQGMNCGFEDCRIMWELMQEHNEDWPTIFKQYEQVRKPEGDAVQDLSLHNYHVMRDYVADPTFLLQKKFERRIESLYPTKYTPLYSQVSFTNTPYTEALKNGQEQDAFIKSVMDKHDIELKFANNSIDDLINSLFENK
jgi:kynurenine 3-monooxygenase